ncbi:hypothetical protein Aab01nite_32720 [Paractinoplanes abujensis]|nr:hypothetical protein Aab01nite_32720 [Actinoplanes abujensis]
MSTRLTVASLTPAFLATSARRLVTRQHYGRSLQIPNGNLQRRRSGLSNLAAAAASLPAQGPAGALRAGWMPTGDDDPQVAQRGRDDVRRWERIVNEQGAG